MIGDGTSDEEVEPQKDRQAGRLGGQEEVLEVLPSLQEVQ